MGCKQMENETIKAYFKRFNEATLNTPGQDERMITGAFTYGLLPSPLSWKLLGKIPATRQELKERVERYIRQEEATSTKLSYLRPGNNDVKRKGNEQRDQRNNYNRNTFRNNRQQHNVGFHANHRTPYPRPDVMTVEDKTKQPQGNMGKTFKDKFCDYHGIYGHTTASCTTLRKEIESKLQNGKLEDLSKITKLKAPMSQQHTPQQEQKNKGKNKEFFTLDVRPRPYCPIRKKPTNVKLNTTQISFSGHDPTPAHWDGDNALVVEGAIGNLIVHRVYIDTGSAADIMFEQLFNFLPSEWKENLQAPKNKLIGFTGHSVWPLGTLLLPFTLKDHRGEKRSTVHLEFLVVRAPSEYNIILGRTGLLKFGAVASTVHGLLKFPTRYGIAVAMSEKISAIACNQIIAPEDLVRDRKRSRDIAEQEAETV